jgi:hypothetical protein
MLSNYNLELGFIVFSEIKQILKSLQIFKVFLNTF